VHYRALLSRGDSKPPITEHVASFACLIIYIVAVARLPVELYETVLRRCSRSGLITLARVSRTTQPEAEHILYRDVKFLANTRGAVMSAVMFCKRICQSSRRAAYVISLQSMIRVGSACYPPRFANFSLVLCRGCRISGHCLTKSQPLDFTILTCPPFKLWTFESDSNDGSALFEFLITQSELRSLFLRLLPSTIHFPLSPHILPNLTVLLASTRDASHLIIGRPISHVYMWDKPTLLLKNLPSSGSSIKVLRVFVVSHTTMKTIAQIAPNIEVLEAQTYIRNSHVCGRYENLSM
jgi:hypothetical protein